MTVERKIVVGLEDIKAVTFECHKCKSRLSFLPDRQIDIPQQCNCGQRWIIGDVPTNSPFRKFTDALHAARNMLKPESSGFRVLLEFDEPIR